MKISHNVAERMHFALNLVFTQLTQADPCDGHKSYVVWLLLITNRISESANAIRLSGSTLTFKPSDLWPWPFAYVWVTTTALLGLKVKVKGQKSKCGQWDSERGQFWLNNGSMEQQQL